jgi:hypothetical protein
MPGMLRAIVTCGLLAGVACSGCGRPSGQDTVEVIGDTIVVRSVQSGLWGGTRTLREDLRIGSVDGPVELSFGEVLELALTQEGGVVFYDGYSSRVSVFSHQGAFLGYVGRRGQGPGEFTGVKGLVALPNGEMWIVTTRDKILLFSSAREYVDEWSVPRRIASDGGPVVLDDGRVALKILPKVGTPLDQAVAYEFYLLSPQGEVLDSAGPLSTPWDSEYEGDQSHFASRYVDWSPHDFGVAAVSSRLAFQVFEWNGGVVRVERPSERPPYAPDERQEHEAQQEFLRRRSGQPARFPRIPERKPAFGRVLLSRTGEIYFQMRTEASGRDPARVAQVAGLPTTPDWLEPLALEAFDRAGRYLGRVEGPSGVVPMAASGDTLWGLCKGSLGETYVVRFLF